VREQAKTRSQRRSRVNENLNISCLDKSAHRPHSETLER
jgi:hypothetical protein